MALDNINIKGAREHNLKNLHLTLPRQKLVVITGLSGSGKSSLAFDTIYAEGQRRYVESLSAYARQFLELMEKPDVDSIDGLSPAISIEQKTSSRNPRSTVGTVTEIYDYLRLLYARIGRVFCYGCGREISSQTAQHIVDQIQTIPSGKKIMILAPIARERKGEFKKEILDIKRKGFVRARIDGEIRSLDEEISLNKKFKHKNLYSAIYPYGITNHRHLSEIDQELFKTSKSPVGYSFIPHLIPTFRGLLSAMYVEKEKNVTLKKIHKELIRFHKKNYFIKIAKINKNIGTESVINSNFCEISVCKLRFKNKILILSAIDNLVKGAGGQAIQNMNLIFGFKENLGLK